MQIFQPLALIILPSLISFALNIYLWYYLWAYKNNSIQTATALDAAVNRPLTYPIKSYHLLLVLANVVDLPYYLYLSYQNYLTYMYWIDNGNLSTSSELDNLALQKFILQVIFVLGHVSNIFIYLLFHKEFRTTAFNLLCLVRNFLFVFLIYFFTITLFNCNHVLYQLPYRVISSVLKSKRNNQNVAQEMDLIGHNDLLVDVQQNRQQQRNHNVE